MAAKRGVRRFSAFSPKSKIVSKTFASMGKNDTSVEGVKKMPHKHTSIFLFRDYLRVIRHKYDDPESISGLSQMVRRMFNRNRYVDDRTRLEFTGAGTKFLGLISCEEEGYETGIKDPLFKNRVELLDALTDNMDVKTIDSEPYAFQDDIWTQYGLDDYAQSSIWLKMHQEAEHGSYTYTKNRTEERDAAREWLLKRMELVEKANWKSRVKERNAADKEFVADWEARLAEVFTVLDRDGSGLVTFHDIVAGLHEHTRGFRDFHMLWDDWLYVNDVLGNEDYELGLDAEQLKRVYLDYKFFDLDYQHNVLCGGSSDAKGRRVYNVGDNNVVLNTPAPLLLPHMAMKDFADFFDEQKARTTAARAQDEEVRKDREVDTESIPTLASPIFQDTVERIFECYAVNDKMERQDVEAWLRAKRPELPAEKAESAAKQIINDYGGGYEIELDDLFRLYFEQANDEPDVVIMELGNLGYEFRTVDPTGESEKTLEDNVHTALLYKELHEFDTSIFHEYLKKYDLPIEGDKQKLLTRVENHVFELFETDLNARFRDRWLRVYRGETSGEEFHNRVF